MPEFARLAVFRENPSWRHQLLRLIAEVPAGGGNFFEILETASKIRAGDEEDWYTKWYNLGLENFSKGLAAQRKRKGSTSRDNFLRAANYFRMADFYLAPDDRREIPMYDKVVKAFEAASKYLKQDIEKVRVPYNFTTMPGYFLRAPSRDRAPVIILMGGADSLKEEYYFRGAQECVERGMSCLLIDGPGQGTPLRKNKLYLRYDYEKPVSAMVDYLSSRKDVDPKRIGYVSSSLGGYFAVRAPAYEKRLAAAVAWSACYDVLEDIYDYFPPIQRRLRHIAGANDDADARRRLRHFTLKGSVEKVRCPLLVVHGEEDYVCSVKAAYKVYGEAICEKTLKIYKKGELGALHAQQDNLDGAKAFIFDWLVEKLAR